jgi:hypothetical protein
MATINFPDTTDQLTDGSFKYEFEGITYIWDGLKWTSQGSGGSGGGNPGTIPGNGTLTIKDSSGTELGVFTANQATGTDTEINLPTGGGGDTFSGDYNDLINKPSIPDATSDLTNDSGFIDDPGVTKIIAGNNVTINNDGTGEVTISSSGGTGGGGGSVTVDLAWDADGNNDAQILSSAGNPATVPIVSNNFAGLMTGDQKQKLEQIDNDYISTIDLTYQEGDNKDSAGKVKANAGGSDATIPIATNTQAGLISGTLHGKLNGLDLSQYLVDNDNVSRLTNDVSYLRNGNRDNVSQLNNDAQYVTSSVLDGITAQNPINITNSKQIQLLYSKGLNLVNNNLEVDLGSGLVYDGNEIKADIPEQSVDVFAPIVVINPAAASLNCKRGVQELPDFATGNFVIPDGASKFAVVVRVKAGIKCILDVPVTSGAVLQQAWSENIGAGIKFGGGAIWENTGTNEDLMSVNGLTVGLRSGNQQAGFLVRMGVCSVPGSGNRTIDYSIEARVDDSVGDGNGVLAQMLWSSTNLLILPTD